MSESLAKKAFDRDLENVRRVVDECDISKMDKKGKKRAELAKAYLAYTESFFHDAEAFTSTKRFERFKGYVRDGISTLLMQMGMRPESRKGAPPDFSQMVRDTIRIHSLLRYAKECEEADIKIADGMKDAIADLKYDGGGSAHEMLGAIKERSQSLLWMMNYMNSSSNPIEWEIGNKDEEPMMLSTVHWVTAGETETMNHIYEDSFSKACYDYVCIQAIDKGLNEDNWLTSIKKMTNEQLLFIASKTFEYAIAGVEDRAAYILLVAKAKESALQFLYKAKRAEEALDALEGVMKHALDEYSEKAANKEIEKENLRKEVSSLKNQLDAVQNSADEVERLKRELKKQEKQYEALKEKYESAVAFADSLAQHGRDDEALEEDIPEEDIKEIAASLQDKRIVFVRDKRQANYVIMKRLAILFPNAKFTNGIASDINAKTTDLIVTLCLYVCHGTYYGADSVSRRKGIPMLPTKNANVGIIVKQIRDKFA